MMALYEWLVLLAAGSIRGFSGFGFAMVAVTGLSLVRSPAEVVPAVLLLELVAGLHLLPRVWRKVEWHSLIPLLAGSAAGTLPGASLLALAPVAVLRLWVSVLVCTAATLLASGWQIRRRAQGAVTFLTGVVSGLLNASAAIGGPPVILYYLGSQATVEASRASLIAFFLFADVFSLVGAYGAGLFHLSSVRAGLLWLVPAWIGVFLGHRLFTHWGGAERYRRVVPILLLLLGLTGLVRATLELMG